MTIRNTSQKVDQKRYGRNFDYWRKNEAKKKKGAGK